MTQDASEMYGIGTAYGNQKQDLPGFRGKFPLLS